MSEKKKDCEPIDIFEGSVTQKYRITFVRDVLGTQSSDLGAHDEFISSKAPDSELSKQENDAVKRAVEDLDEDELEKAPTLFPRDIDGNPIMYDYQLKGMLKSAAGALKRKVSDSPSHVLNLPAYKTVVDQEVFIEPREIKLIMPEGKKMDFYSRTLRADTARGPRIAISTSERIPEGTYCDVEILCLTEKLKVKGKSVSLVSLLEAWLSYGRLSGLLQWRNAGFGRFKFERLNGNAK